MIGLTALTALLAMAFAGATSAMAESTSLCKADESPCSAANQIGSVHEESVGKSKLLTSLGITECNVLFSGTITTKLANPLVISGAYTWTNCKLGESTCTVTEATANAEIKVLKEGHETATSTVNVGFQVGCPGFIECTFVSAGLKGTAKGPLLSAQVPDNGEVTQLETILNKVAGGFLCPKSVKLDITTTPLTATYISG